MNSVTNFYTLAVLSLLITALIVNLAFGALVFARTYLKAYGWYFALTILGIVLWSIGGLLLLFTKNSSYVHFGAELFYIAPLIIPIFIWFFAISFPENHRPNLSTVVASIVIFSVFGAAFAFNFEAFIKNIQIRPGLNLVTPNLPGFFIYALYYSVFFILAYHSFFSKSRHLRGLSRTQVVYTFCGALLASIPAMMTNLSFPIMGRTDLIWLGPLFTLFFAGAVTVAIIRHRLFDIRPVVVRSLGYGLTIIAIASIYGFLVFGLAQLIFGLHFPVELQIAFSASTGIAALLFQSFKRFFDKMTNRFFYRDAYDPQAFFDQLNKAIVSTIDLDSLLTNVSHIIASNLKAGFCVIELKTGELSRKHTISTVKQEITKTDLDQIHQFMPGMHYRVIVTDNLGDAYQALKEILLRNNIALLARLTANYHENEEGLGYVALGTKKSGNPYTINDIEILNSATNELHVAVQNALRFEEIENFNITLQQKVTDATRRLSETNRKLKLLDETKDDFISMASHQLRTPLTSVKGYLSLVLEGDAGKITGTQHKLLGQAFISSQRMVYLIADLLNVSRLKTGKFIIEATNVNLADIVNDEIDQLVETAASRNLALIYHKPMHFPTLQLDETKIRQVIMNFIDNAIYYTPAGGHIEVELRELPKSVEVRVKDDGIGVPKDERHHLFSKFFRAKNAQKARPDGTGLGLFMAKKVIIAQGGAIIFESREGSGSTFGFTFPKHQIMVDKVKTTP